MKNELLIFLFFLSADLAIAQNKQQVFPVVENSRYYCNYEALLNEYSIDNSQPIHDKVDYILVSKTYNKTFLIANEKVVRVYPAVFGFRHDQEKLFEGDYKTPEGIYFISSKNNQSSYHKALKISYPNLKDAEYASRQGKNPGFDILLHGLPNPSKNPLKLIKNIYISQAQKYGIHWTQGCVSFSNADIEEVFQLVSVNTPIEICQFFHWNRPE